jgi:hypothetical protein
MPFYLKNIAGRSLTNEYESQSDVMGMPILGCTFYTRVYTREQNFIPRYVSEKPQV